MLPGEYTLECDVVDSMKTFTARKGVKIEVK